MIIYEEFDIVALYSANPNPIYYFFIDNKKYGIVSKRYNSFARWEKTI